ncbi:hypothetical protein DL96DRAFT_1666711 [Flagelloscypha sp. PMI_526]|nr:hypothetical protein DL96DRAFT_1666711 [Flagelloscypha sp. PMI_526]
MAQPSSSHHGERHHRERSSSSHHHHRTISSTTLLLVLSLILAVLAIMLSLPNQGSSPLPGGESNPNTLLSYISPKRSQQLITREGEVARREAEVAKREADILVAAPGGVSVCPPCQASTTVIKEIVKEDSLTPPGWNSPRADEILDRELRVAEREREISKREETVNRREHDASRREGWIMEQLMALGNDNPQTVEDEYVYEPAGAKRKAKYPHYELPPPVVKPVIAETTIATVTQTVTVPPPNKVGGVATPVPEVPLSYSTEAPRTTAVEIVTEEATDDDDYEEAPRRRSRRPPSPWFNW